MSVLERVRIIKGFLKKIYDNFVGTLETVLNTEVSVLERCPYREVPLYHVRRKKNGLQIMSLAAYASETNKFFFLTDLRRPLVIQGLLKVIFLTFTLFIRGLS